MRDLVAREALRDLAEQAGERFREQVRSGREIPYEVLEPGQDSPFCHYVPQTEHFICEQAGLVASLGAYSAAKSAIVSADLARPYLEALGFDNGVSAGRAAEDAVLAFLCRLWHGSTDFALEPTRLEAALKELEECGEADGGEIEVVVPLVGLQMPVGRLELAKVSLVSSETVETPPDLQEASGSGRAEWEPQFLAYSRCDAEDIDVREDSDAISSAPIAARFHEAISAMRVYKAGGVGLGPHGWTRTGGGRWRRISTGAGRPRAGGYRLVDAELSELAAFSRAASRKPSRATAIGRAISRFEAGLERQAPLEALNDHLLALRFLLEGDGPATTGMPLRVAALCAPPDGRDAVRRTIERGVALERVLWSGDPAPDGDGRSPVQIASEVEEHLRAILRDAVCGHLGGDLRATADEILLADGLAVGEGDATQRGETTEWEPGDVELDSDPDDEAWIAGQLSIEEIEEDAGDELEISRFDAGDELEISRVDADVPDPEPSEIPIESPRLVHDGWTPFVPTYDDPPTDERPSEPAPQPMHAPARRAPEGGDEPSDGPDTMKESEPSWQTRERMLDRQQAQTDDWLADAGTPGTTLNFPKKELGPAMRLLDQRPEERAAVKQRVATLFPVPDTVDWSVGELEYNRRRGADVSAQQSA